MNGEFLYKKIIHFTKFIGKAFRKVLTQYEIYVTKKQRIFNNTGSP